jgi:hypothetical protein
VKEDSLAQAAALLHERNAIDAELAQLMQRPMTSGHLGEWIAAQVFDIELEASAVAASIDGRFRSGPLQGRSVNIKWYLKREGLLDTTESTALDYYLVLTGPPIAAASSRGTTRPWCIEAVFLFDARQLRSEQAMRGVKRGTASSVIKHQWAAAEIYPSASNPAADSNLAAGRAAQTLRSLTTDPPGSGRPGSDAQLVSPERCCLRDRRKGRAGLNAGPDWCP